MMAEKSEELVTVEDKLAQAKELFGRGSRNFFVKNYSDAADDLSQVCDTYEEIYGQLCDELGTPYLIYAKTLIALAQDENKVLSVPNEEEGDDEDEDEPNEEDDGDQEEAESNTVDDETQTEKAEKAEKPSEDNEAEPKANGATKKEIEKEENSKTEEAEGSTSKPDSNTQSTSVEPSTSNGVVETDGNEENEEEDEAAANLQIAWEILELAVKIFERQGESSLSKLAEAYNELAGISFENSHFEAAVSDYKKSLDIHMKLPDDNRRIVAEIHYKIGLAQLMQNGFDECIQNLRKASELIDEEIEEEKQKEEKTESQEVLIKDLEETKQDILLKITEVEETKTQSIEEVRNEISKLIGSEPKQADVVGSSSGPSSAGVSSSADKPKATDISHLIKRKKPDSTTSNETDSSPAKRTAV